MFGDEKVMVTVMIIERALYGIKRYGSALREKLADCLMSLGYQSSKKDPNV